MLAGFILYPRGSTGLTARVLAGARPRKGAPMLALRNRAATSCPCFNRLREGLLVLPLLTIPLLAQNAEISGLITDPSGLAVPGAKMVVQRVETGAAREVSSNQRGEYSVPALPPGSYDITIEATGFKGVHQNAIVLEVDQRARLDFTLAVGGNTESITVQGNVPLLNTSDASVSTVIGNRLVENLPLNGRSFSSLITLAPGVVLTPANFYEQ